MANIGFQHINTLMRTLSTFIILYMFLALVAFDYVLERVPTVWVQNYIITEFYCFCRHFLIYIYYYFLFHRQRRHWTSYQKRKKSHQPRLRGDGETAEGGMGVARCIGSGGVAAHPRSAERSSNPPPRRAASSPGLRRRAGRGRRVKGAARACTRMTRSGEALLSLLPLSPFPQGLDENTMTRIFFLVHEHGKEIISIYNRINNKQLTSPIG